MENEFVHIVKELSTELRNYYPDFRGIYFFGSRARGDYNEFSDFDFASVFDRVIDWKFEKEIIQIISKYDLKYQIIIDSHVYNHNDILNPITPFRQNVLKEGLFYA